MNSELRRRLDALEATNKRGRPVHEMTDGELVAAIGLGPNPSEDQLRAVLGMEARSDPTGAGPLQHKGTHV